MHFLFTAVCALTIHFSTSIPCFRFSQFYNFHNFINSLAVLVKCLILRYWVILCTWFSRSPLHIHSKLRKFHFLFRMPLPFGAQVEPSKPNPVSTTEPNPKFFQSPTQNQERSPTFRARTEPELSRKCQTQWHANFITFFCYLHKILNPFFMSIYDLASLFDQ